MSGREVSVRLTAFSGHGVGLSQSITTGIIYRYRHHLSIQYALGHQESRGNTGSHDNDDTAGLHRAGECGRRGGGPGVGGRLRPGGYWAGGESRERSRGCGPGRGYEPGRGSRSARHEHPRPGRHGVHRPPRRAARTRAGTRDHPLQPWAAPTPTSSPRWRSSWGTGTTTSPRWRAGAGTRSSTTRGTTRTSCGSRSASSGTRPTSTSSPRRGPSTPTSRAEVMNEDAPLGPDDIPESEWGRIRPEQGAGGAGGGRGVRGSDADCATPGDRRPRRPERPIHLLAVPDRRRRRGAGTGRSLGPRPVCRRARPLEFYIHLLEQQTAGIFNSVGPGAPLSAAELVYGIRAITATPVSFTWVDWDFLAERGQMPQAPLPFWQPPRGHYLNYGRMDSSRGIAAGLAFRPLAVTAKDTLDWNGAREEAGEHQWPHRA